MLKKMALAMGLVTFLSSASKADLVYGTSADLTGSRTSTNLVLGEEYVGKSLTISWEITNLGGGSWNYAYTLTGFDVPKAGISHVIVDLTDDAVFPVVDADAVTDTTTNGSLTSTVFGEFSSQTQGNSNPGIPIGSSIIGVKFNMGFGTLTGSNRILTFEFESNRAPVWGDFYVKGGGSSYAYNKGLPNHLTSENVLDFLARPNGVTTAVPEPASLISAGMGLGITGLAGLRRRRQARTA